MKFALLSIAPLLTLAAAAVRAMAGVTGVTVADASNGDYTLTSVSVTRGPAGALTYFPSQLISVDLTDVDAYQLPLLVPGNASLPAPGTRASLIEDGRVDTGVTNITTTNGTADRSLQLAFARPVVNSAGADILLFEVGGDDGVRWWVNDDRIGQSADLTTAAYAPALISSMPFTLYPYSNAQTADNVLGLADLESDAGFSFAANSSGDVHALELDLSTVGILPGAAVSSIRFQSLAGAGGRIDPVFVAGLPAVPEPAAATLAGALGLMLLQRRRSCHAQKSPSSN